MFVVAVAIAIAAAAAVWFSRVPYDVLYSPHHIHRV